MARKILDDDLMEWEVFASTGDFGYPEHSTIVFHCLTDMARRSRILRLDGDKAEAERVIQEEPAERLAAMMSAAKELY